MDVSFTEDYVAEWRSSEHLESGMPSTSPPYWDTDEDDDDDCGLRPSELFGTFTWKIENYSQINKRELRSNAFEVGGYKWQILIYPQGCDVCNHLSLFLCVANHEKLLPGWSQFAQFTISVINKDPNISKLSDTLHRFGKKEHDWGWKKFMELSKVEDGFVDNETLIIKAQVQVIREKAHRLFRCLSCEYRRELIRIYLSNVEQICRRFFEDRKKKLSKLIDDKVRWSSFCSFWLGIDQNSRRRVSRDKLDTILRVFVKHFFVEKEVTSTLVMDSLYSGLKSIECQSKNKEERLRIEMKSSAVPMVRVDEDMFVLADDVIALLERVASQPLPAISLPPKDDKIFQNRTKEGSSTDGFIERDERRLTELGRRTIEIFVLSHIFSRIEVAYQEAISLKRQEELIREEEEAGQAEHELKIKRAIAEKDKRTKKKQGKQKRNNRRNKEKQRDSKPDSTLHSQKHVEKSSGGESSLKHGNVMMPEDGSDASCNGDDVDELEPHPSVEADASELSTYTPEKTNLGLDDSSSTCSTDSVPSVVSNGTRKEDSMTIINIIETSPNRAKNSGNKQSHVAEISNSSPSSLHEFEGGDDASQKPLIQSHERTLLVEKQDPAPTTPPKKPYKDTPPNTRQLQSSSSPSDPARKTPPVLHHSKQSQQNLTTSIPPPSTSRSKSQNPNTISKSYVAPNPNTPPISNPSPFAPSYFPLSYRNAIIGKPSSSSPVPPRTNTDHGVSSPNGCMADEFPHLDIINDLLNEEQSTSNQYHHPLHHRHRSFSGRFSFPVDAASMDSSARFGLTDDSFLSVYGISSSARALERIHGGRFGQVELQISPYGNRRWVYNPADLSFVNLGGVNGGGMYSYQNISDNLGRGMNQYGLYRP